MTGSETPIDRFRLSDVKTETVDALGGMPQRVAFFSEGRKKYRLHHNGKQRRVEVMNVSEDHGEPYPCERCGNKTPGGEIHYWRVDYTILGYVAKTIDGGRIYYCPDCGGNHWRYDI